MVTVRSTALLVALALASLAVASALAAGQPKVGKYVGASEGNKLLIEVVKPGQRARVHLRRLKDDCVPAFIGDPLGIGPVKNRRFHRSIRGSDVNGDYTVEIKGRFTGAKRAEVEVETTGVGTAASPGPLPNCPSSTSFRLKFRPGSG